MKWRKTTVVFESGDPETAAALINEIFQELGLTGVIIESPDSNADLDWAEDAPFQADHNAVIGFFTEKHHGEKYLQLLKYRVEELKPSIISRFEISASDIDDEDWAESWKLHFHPIKITDKIVIRPGWQHYDALEGDIIIELDPGMAFGTGTHPTTALCIRMVEQYMTPGIKFLDIGTGSGILMITAAKTGAGKLTGIDCDPVALEVAENNLLTNDISADDFTLIEGDLVAAVNGSFEMIAANIVAETICRLVPDIVPLLSPGGIFIASGIIVEKEPMVLEKLCDHGFEISEIRQLEGWCAVAARYKDAG